MLLTDHFVEPGFDLGKGVTCLMLTRKSLDERSQISSNLLSSITGKPVQFMKQVHGVNIKTVNSYTDEPFEETDGIFTKSNGIKVSKADIFILFRGIIICLILIHINFKKKLI